MMPDLGKYAVSVLAAYGTSIVLLAGLVGLSLWQRGRVKRMLTEIEARQEKTDG